MALKAPRIMSASRGLSLAGLGGAIAFFVIVNALALRHHRRWDVSSARTHSLSPATIATLRGLTEPVDVWVLLGGAEPLFDSVRHALEAYRAETERVVVHFVDPDKDAAAYEDARRKFGLVAGRAEAGRSAENVAIVVARGERHWYVERSDLVEIESVADARVKPREERALTSAIRAVLSGEKARVCFVTGHDEPALGDFGPRGAGALADVLRKDNSEADSVDTTAPNARSPFEGCAVVVVATPRRTFSKEEEERLRTYLLQGGSALFALSPVAASRGFVPPGLSAALAPFGIGVAEALVVETDPNATFPEARGTQFIAEVRPHPVTAALAAAGPFASAPPPVVLSLVRPVVRASEPGASSPVALLATSDHAFGATEVDADTEWSEMPSQSAHDLPGPLTLAMASERPKLGPSASRGPRVVVVGTSSVLAHTEADPLSIGGAFFAEGAVSWLAARQPVLDIPDKPPVTAGVRLTEASQAEVKRYVLVLIPLTFLVLGLIVGWSRRRPAARRSPRPS
jgi:hypothetical protein